MLCRRLSSFDNEAFGTAMAVTDFFERFLRRLVVVTTEVLLVFEPFGRPRFFFAAM